MNKTLLTESPCVGICSTSFGDDICFGCQRTYLEVIQWNTLNDDEKDCINQRLLGLSLSSSSSDLLKDKEPCRQKVI